MVDVVITEAYPNSLRARVADVDGVEFDAPTAVSQDSTQGNE